MDGRVGAIVANQFLERLQQLGLPFVAVGSHAHPLHTNYVMADVMNGIRLAVEHLSARGRTQIGLVNGPPTTGTSASKLDGYRLALALHDLPFVACMGDAGNYAYPSRAHRNQRGFWCGH